MDRELRTVEVAEPNAFSVDAATAAFSDEGWEWLVSLRAYIEENKKTVYAFIEKELPGLYAVPQNATYLMWLDINRFLRLNTACPRSLLEDGLTRLRKGLELWQAR